MTFPALDFAAFIRRGEAQSVTVIYNFKFNVQGVRASHNSHRPTLLSSVNALHVTE